MPDSTILRRVPIFAQLSAEVLEALSERLRRRHYRRGDSIFVTGDPGSSLYIVEQGRVKLSLLSSEGKEAIIDLLGPTEVFGELALLDGEPRSADAAAAEPSDLLLLERGEFLAFIQRHPEACIELLGVLSRRIRRDSMLLQDSIFLDVRARLARTLIRIADARPDGALVTPKLTQAELAGLCGTTRETLNKWLGTFQDEALIRLEQGRIVILEPDALRRRILG